MVAGGASLVEAEDPLEAEIVGAALLSIGALAGEGFEEALTDGFIPEIEARATPEALAMLLAIGSVAEGQAAKAASVAADRLAEAGVARPSWAAELAEPMTVGDCWRCYDPQGIASMLVYSFHRAGRSHAVVISVDHTDCDAAEEILLFGADQLPEALVMMQASGRDNGLEIMQEALDPAEFRWQVIKALDARAVHDRGVAVQDMMDMLADEDDLSYPAMAVLVRAWMRALPAPSKPAPPHGNEQSRQSALTTLQQLAGRAGNAVGPFGAAGPFGAVGPFGVQGPAKPRGRTGGAKLPKKRAKSAGPAPIYQIKVGLRGAKPPIWRRLQVPADTSLARLHDVIQAAFGWNDSHLHVFETSYGSFGTADAELGHRAEAPVTLEQVAPGVNSKLRYTYDFGDDWEHEIVVEKVLDRDASATYPRCTGGRRAAPPDDCGGVWGYADLMEILNDPDHPEHEDRLEWLGLDTADDFDPDEFNAEAVSRALSALR